MNHSFSIWLCAIMIVHASCSDNNAQEEKKHSVGTTADGVYEPDMSHDSETSDATTTAINTVFVETGIHPEQKPDEIFLHNTIGSSVQFGTMGVIEMGYRNIPWKTKRPGAVAYGSYGQVVGRWPDFFPVFVKKTEWEEQQQTMREWEKSLDSMAGRTNAYLYPVDDF